jgi:hypothetical protein
MANIYKRPHIPCFLPVHHVHPIYLLNAFHPINLTNLTCAFDRLTDPIHESMANTAERSPEAVNEPNPNGFVTERELAGERRSIRRYNDGRVSGRSASVEPGPRTRASTRNSSRSCSRNDTGNTTRASSRMGPFISRRSSFTDRPPSAIQSKLSDMAAEISAEVVDLFADNPDSSTAKKFLVSWSIQKNAKGGTATPKHLTHSTGASVTSSNCSTKTNGSVIARIADIEDRVRKHNVRLKPVLEGDE